MIQNLDRFKFRVFHKRNGVSSPLMYVEENITGAIEVIKHNPELENEVIIMQCTALRDINDNLIYEGDVVKWGHLEGSKEDPVRIAVVEINPDIQFRRLDITAKQGFLGQNHIFKFGSFAYTNTHQCLEIVGNIYEHPKLQDIEEAIKVSQELTKNFQDNQK